MVEFTPRSNFRTELVVPASSFYQQPRQITVVRIVISASAGELGSGDNDHFSIGKLHHCVTYQSVYLSPFPGS